MARPRNLFGLPDDESAGPGTKLDQFGAGGFKPPSGPFNAPSPEPPAAPQPGIDEPIPVRDSEKPRERDHDRPPIVGGSSSLRIPPPAAVPDPLQNVLGLLDSRQEPPYQGGGAPTPMMPDTPSPISAGAGHPTFYGNLPQGGGNLFGYAGGLLGGGLGVPEAAAGPGPDESDISALIRQLLQQGM